MNSFDALNPEDFIAQGDVFLMEHEQVDGVTITVPPKQNAIETTYPPP